MILSAEQFAEIVQHLSPHGRDEAKHGRRRAARVGFRARLRVTLLPPSSEGDWRNPRGTCATIDVKSCDISPRGVGFLFPSPLPRGQQFLVHLARHNERQVSILCTVVHCELGSSAYAIGAEFTCTASEPTATATPEQLDHIRESILD